MTWSGYDTFGDVTEAKDPDGNVTTYAYDADGRQASETLPPYTPPGGSPVTAQDTTAYDGDGLVTSTTDGLVNTTRYGYDQLGDRTTVTAPDNTVTTTAYDGNGEPLSVTTPTGAQAGSTWDYLGRRATSTQVERYTGSGTAAYTTGYSYNDASGGGWLSQVTSPDKVSTQYAYNPAGEKTSVTNGAGGTTSYSYDFLGRQAKVTYPGQTATAAGYDAAGNATSTSNLDASGNVLAATSATFNGEGGQLSATDAAGNSTGFTYDPAGLVTAEVQPVTSSSGITTSFGYDAAGSQTLYTDGNGNPWQYTYNSWGLQESRVEPATSRYSSPADSTFTTAYDADQRPAVLSEPGGVTVTDTYNSTGELTGQSGAGADAATPARTFGYSTDGSLTSAATSNTAPSGSNATSETFTYNDRHQVTAASGSGGSTTYGYNGDGQVATVADAAGTTSYTYDGAGRLATLADPATGTTATYSYNPDSQVSSVSYGPGKDTQSFGYDNQRRLTSDTLKTSAGATVASAGYGYNPDGQVTTEATAGLAGPSSSSYTYDQAGRLTSWNNGTTVTNYGYDGNGNLTGNGAKTLAYDARDELTGDGTSSYAYTARGTASSESSPAGNITVAFDAYGDQASAGTRSYAYDALGRLTADTPTAGGAGYAFSYVGSTGTVASDGTSGYTWDPAGSTLIAVGAPGGGTGGTLAFTSSHGDLLGQFTPAGTGMSGSKAYDPWGTVTTGTTTGMAGFQSAWTDPASAKDLMGARWYNPPAGDFTSADTVQVSPVPDPAAASPFAYAADNPLSYTDPTGHCILCSLASALKSAVTAARTVVKTVARAVKAVVKTVPKVVKAAVKTVKTVVKAVFPQRKPTTAIKPKDKPATTRHGASPASQQHKLQAPPGCPGGEADALQCYNLHIQFENPSSTGPGNTRKWTMLELPCQSTLEGLTTLSGCGTMNAAASGEEDSGGRGGSNSGTGGDDPSGLPILPKIPAGNASRATGHILEGPVPQNAQDTLDHIDQNGTAPPGYGLPKWQGKLRPFGNKEGILPKVDSSGNPITYTEFDVNPFTPGVNRGGERLITGSDGSRYYTNDHYQNFYRMR